MAQQKRNTSKAFSSSVTDGGGPREKTEKISTTRTRVFIFISRRREKREREREREREEELGSPF